MKQYGHASVVMMLNRILSTTLGKLWWQIRWLWWTVAEWLHGMANHCCTGIIRCRVTTRHSGVKVRTQLGWTGVCVFGNTKKYGKQIVVIPPNCCANSLIIYIKTVTHHCSVWNCIDLFPYIQGKIPFTVRHTPGNIHNIFFICTSISTLVDIPGNFHDLWHSYQGIHNYRAWYGYGNIFQTTYVLYACTMCWYPMVYGPKPSMRIMIATHNLARATQQSILQP